MIRTILFIFTASQLLTSCAATGDWDEDTIAFKPQMADQRLMALRAELSAINRETDVQRRRTALLEAEISEATRSRKATQVEVSALRGQIAQMEDQLAITQGQLGAIKTKNQTITAEREVLLGAIATQSLRLSKLRAQLALILSIR